MRPPRIGVRGRSGPAAIAALAILASSLAAVGADAAPTTGGRLVAALRAEPSTLNPTTALRTGEWTVIGRIHDSLVRLDRETLEPVPALAESWTVSDEGRVLDLQLRRGVLFSDGEPFDADDVVFTFQTLLDEKNASPWRASFVLGGEPVRVTATGSHSVRFELSQPRAAAVRMLDGIGILPEHRVRSVVEAGGWPEAWGVATPPGEMAGLGPFRLARYRAGERLVLERNPHYWKRDAQGARLPYLDEIEFVFVPGEDAEVVRFGAGDTQVIENVSPENFQALQRGGSDRVLTDVGAGLRFSMLVFNLNDLSGRSLPDIEARQAWFRKRGFRRAVSAAIDRSGIVRVVYRGRAAPLATQESPSNQAWLSPALEPQRRDLEAARRELRAAGFAWIDGKLVDEQRRPVRFSILVSGTTRTRIASLLQQDLEPLGIAVDVAPFDGRSLQERLLESFEYETALVELQPDDADPLAHLSTLTTGGGTHFWQMGEEAVADWERELDRLMQDQGLTVDRSRRRELYERAQQIVASELPFIPLVSPHVLVGTRAGLQGCRPSVLVPRVLWNAEELYWEPPPR